MSGPAYSSARLQRLYAEGRCVRCGLTHQHISRVTQRPAWRCVDCCAEMQRDKAMKRRRLGRRRAEVRPALQTAAPRTMSPSVYTAHDPIAARFRWATVVAR
jgi:hypothetical protein